jgi:hypothetical protein
VEPDIILAIDLGRYNSVARWYDPRTSVAEFRSNQTTPNDVRLIDIQRPAQPSTAKPPPRSRSSKSAWRSALDAALPRTWQLAPQLPLRRTVQDSSFRHPSCSEWMHCVRLKVATRWLSFRLHVAATLREPLE